MNRDDLRAGIFAGSIAAMATAGALVAIGSRVATAARPFNLVAGHLLGARADVIGFEPGVTLVGAAIHLLLMVIVATLVAAVTRRRTLSLRAAVILATIFCALVSIGIARRGNRSLAGFLAIGDLVVFYLTLAVSLGIGMRIARLSKPM